MLEAVDWTLPPAAVTRWLLVRHGEPDPRARGRCYGRLDVGLSELGKRQIATTAHGLARTPLTAVYSSPLARAMESAEIVAAPHRLETRQDERLAEIDFGELEGLTYEEVERLHPQLYRAWMERPTEVRFPGGESFRQMRKRVLEAATELKQRHRRETVAIVAHGGVHRILLAEALGLPEANLFRIEQSYGALSVIAYYEDSAVVERVNQLAVCIE